MASLSTDNTDLLNTATQPSSQNAPLSGAASFALEQEISDKYADHSQPVTKKEEQTIPQETATQQETTNAAAATTPSNTTPTTTVDDDGSTTKKAKVSKTENTTTTKQSATNKKGTSASETADATNSKNAPTPETKAAATETKAATPVPSEVKKTTLKEGVGTYTTNGLKANKGRFGAGIAAAGLTSGLTQEAKNIATGSGSRTESLKAAGSSALAVGGECLKSLIPGYTSYQCVKEGNIAGAIGYGLLDVGCLALDVFSFGAGGSALQLAVKSGRIASIVGKGFKFGEVFGKAGGAIAKGVSKAPEFLGKAGKAITEVGGTVASKVSGAIPSGVKNVAHGVADGVKGAASKAYSFFTGKAATETAETATKTTAEKARTVIEKGVNLGNKATNAQTVYGIGSDVSGLNDKYSNLKKELGITDSGIAGVLKVATPLAAGVLAAEATGQSYDTIKNTALSSGKTALSTGLNAVDSLSGQKPSLSNLSSLKNLGTGLLEKADPSVVSKAKTLLSNGMDSLSTKNTVLPGMS